MKKEINYLKIAAYSSVFLALIFISFFFSFGFIGDIIRNLIQLILLIPLLIGILIIAKKNKLTNLKIISVVTVILGILYGLLYILSLIFQNINIATLLLFLIFAYSLSFVLFGIAILNLKKQFKLIAVLLGIIGIFYAILNALLSFIPILTILLLIFGIIFYILLSILFFRAIKKYK